jgi:hypothetical protein
MPKNIPPANAVLTIKAARMALDDVAFFTETERILDILKSPQKRYSTLES